MEPVTYATAWICNRCEEGARQLAPAPESVVQLTPAAVSDVTTDELVQRLIEEAGIDRGVLEDLSVEDVLALRALRFRAEHHPDERLKRRCAVVAERLHWAPERLRTLARRYGGPADPRPIIPSDSNGATTDGSR